MNLVMFLSTWSNKRHDAGTGCYPNQTPTFLLSQGVILAGLESLFGSGS